MEDRVQKLHGIRACGIADDIVSGKISVSDMSADENALGIIAAVTIVESLPSSALESIEKMFPND